MVGIACLAAGAFAYWGTVKLVAPSPKPPSVSLNSPPPDPAGSPVRGVATTTRITEPPALSFQGDTNDAVALLNHGTELLSVGRVAEAIQFYERAATLNPEDEEAQFNLGVAFARLARIADSSGRTNDVPVFFNEAARHYNEALRIFPEHAEAHNNLGNLLVEQRRYNEAIPHYSAAIRVNPDYSSAIDNLGKCLALQGKAEEALVQFHEAVRLNTNYVEARFNLANACMLLGRFDEAIRELEEVLRIAPEFELAARRLADAKSKKAGASK
jgi:tetratricopeptide (TPR) repeat protein